MPKRRTGADSAAEPNLFPQSSAPEHLRSKEILDPDEVGEWLGVTRKVVFSLPIDRLYVTTRNIRYRASHVEEFLNKSARPQALGFLYPASFGMNRQDLSIREVSRLLRTRWATAAAFIAPAKRISLEALETLILDRSSSPPVG